MIHDILSRSTIEQELAVSRQRLSAALRAGRLGVYEYQPHSGLLIWDERLRGIWGIPANEEPSYACFLAQIHPDDRAATEAAVQGAIRPGGIGRYDAEYRVQNRQTGEERWIRAVGDTSFSGHVAVLLVGTVADITDEKQLQAENALLLLELEHRGKNLLSVVQALARQTFRDDICRPAQLEAFNGRLRALDATQSALLQRNWQSTELKALIETVLHVARKDLSSISLEGPDVRVGSKPAQWLSLILHELCTNALKHGALSVDGGHISVRWRHEGSGLCIIWSEQGGPPVAGPSRKGFGSQLIARAIPSSCGSAALDYRPEGVECRIHLRMLHQAKAPAPAITTNRHSR